MTEIRKSTKRRFKEIGKSFSKRVYDVPDMLVRGWDSLAPEQQERVAGMRSTPAPPSVADVRQGATASPQSQVNSPSRRDQRAA